jgi:hypothetical protein
LGEKLNVKVMSDWYNITLALIEANHGMHVYVKYGESPSGMVMGIFKDHEWHPWKFKFIPRNYWTKPDHQAKFVKYVVVFTSFFLNENIFRYLGGQLGYKTLGDWYGVALGTFFYFIYFSTNNPFEADFQKEGSGLLSQFSGSPILILMSVYPNHKWERWRFRNFGVSDMSPEDMQPLLAHINIL